MELYEPVKQNEQFFEMSKSSNYRTVLSKVIQHPPKLMSVGDWDENGDIKFSIGMRELGLTNQEYRQYEHELFSYFIVDFLGELIVRENLSIFVEKLQNYDINDYMIAIEDKHKRFGIKTEKGKLVFIFHVSFLKNILTEDLRESLE